MLLFRYSRLWYCPTCKTNNTEAHAVCIYTRKRVLNTHHGRLVSHCLDKLMKFTRSRIAKTKRVRRFFQYVLAVLRRQATTKTFASAKVRRNFDICK